MNVYQFVCVLFYQFCFEGAIWDLIVLIPDHCHYSFFNVPIEPLFFSIPCTYYQFSNQFVHKRRLISIFVSNFRITQYLMMKGEKGNL